MVEARLANHVILSCCFCAHVRIFRLRACDQKHMQMISAQIRSCRFVLLLLGVNKDTIRAREPCQSREQTPDYSSTHVSRSDGKT